MARTKTVKKAGTTAKAKTAQKKATQVRDYSMTETFAVGDMVYHKVWDDTGEVVEVSSTEDGVKKIKVLFEKVGDKCLRAG